MNLGATSKDSGVRDMENNQKMEFWNTGVNTRTIFVKDLAFFKFMVSRKPWETGKMISSMEKRW